MRGDLGRPLEEFWRVGTAAQVPRDTEECTEMRKDSIQHYAEGQHPLAPAAMATLPRSQGAGTQPATTTSAPSARRRKRRTAERSDVLVSAVISTYLLTHLHHVLQRAEYGAQQDGNAALAGNYAQLRKVLCLDARSMEDASASGDTEPVRHHAA